MRMLFWLLRLATFFVSATHARFQYYDKYIACVGGQLPSWVFDISSLTVLAGLVFDLQGEERRGYLTVLC